MEYARKILQLEQSVAEKLAAIEVKAQPMPLYISHYLADKFFYLLFSCPISTTFLSSPYELHSLSYKELKTVMLNEEAKFALMPLYDEDEAIKNQFRCNVLFEEDLYLIVPKQHKLASWKLIYLKDIENEQLLLPQGYYYQQLVKNALYSIKQQYVLMTNFSLIQKAVEQNMGIAFVSLESAQQSNPNVSYKKVSGLSLKRKNGIVRNAKMVLNDMEQFFCKNIKEQFS